MTHIEKL